MSCSHAIVILWYMFMSYLKLAVLPASLYSCVLLIKVYLILYAETQLRSEQHVRGEWQI